MGSFWAARVAIYSRSSSSASNLDEPSLGLRSFVIADPPPRTLAPCAMCVRAIGSSFRSFSQAVIMHEGPWVGYLARNAIDGSWTRALRCTGWLLCPCSSTCHLSIFPQRGLSVNSRASTDRTRPGGDCITHSRHFVRPE
jgi:hypothetical protein